MFYFKLIFECGHNDRGQTVLFYYFRIMGWAAGQRSELYWTNTELHTELMQIICSRKPMRMQIIEWWIMLSIIQSNQIKLYLYQYFPYIKVTQCITEAKNKEKPHPSLPCGGKGLILRPGAFLNKISGVSFLHVCLASLWVV